MHFKGKGHKVGDHIDTDAIIPARYLVTTDPEELGRNCMSGLEEGWVSRVSRGDILLGGKNFGCGSSREHAPIAILGAGIPVVIAHSFARIFYRNGFNMGLILMEVGDEIKKLGDGDELEVKALEGKIINHTTGDTVDSLPVPEFMADILAKGGLINYVRERVA
ncbi:3-isopropylmalate dehydratase small subunit [Desulfonatronospira sp.]|uniref:3-isopropylmalate dehydratase small subunit n=1 Tax=Desulfonatronospira sp. TaxID=1962951 RepID=UPI0025BFDCE6|nr:3-isopropylmalate dehydratase small subunit [Desulfonatronospira sp.]